MNELNIKNKKKYFFVAIFIFFVLVAGIVFDLTKLAIFFKVKSAGLIYSGYSFQQPDSIVMMPEWRDVLDGHWRSSDGMTYENTYEPFIWTNTPNNILLAPLIFALGSADKMFLVGYFLMGSLAFIIFYLILNLITKNKKYSMISSLLFVSAGNIFYIIFPLTWEQIKLTIRTFTFLGSPPLQILGNRYESLSILPGFLPFGLSFLFIYLAITKNKKVWIILSGIFSGALLYLYPSSAMYMWTVLGVMMLLFLLIRELKLAKNIFIILSIAIVFSFLNWFNYFSLKFLPWSNELFLTLGGEFGHSPRLGWHLLEYLLYIIFAFLLWQLAKQKEDKKIGIYLISFLIAPIFLLNIQVLTGFSPFPHAWYVHQFYYGFALCLFVFFYWVYSNLKEGSIVVARIFLSIGIITAIILFVRVIHANLYTANLYYKGYTISQSDLNVFNWLNKNTEKDSVVVSPSIKTNYLISIFSHNRVIFPHPITFPGSLSELLDRWMIVHKLYGVPTNYFKEIILNNKSFIFYAYFHDNRIGAYLKQDLVYEEELQNKFLDKLAEIKNSYDNYPERLGYLLTRYKMDYFYVGHEEKEVLMVDFDKYNWLDMVYDNEGVSIYKINYEKVNLSQ